MSDRGQGPAGFSWGEALNAALPIVGLTAGLYARPEAGQHIASFAQLMALNYERERIQQERERAEREREAEREAFRLYPDIIKGMPSTMEIPSLPGLAQPTDPAAFAEQFGAPRPEGYVEERPPTSVAFQRMPTLTEALGRAQGLPTRDEGVKAHLVKLVAHSRLPTAPEIPKEIQQQRETAALAQSLLQSGRVSTPEEAQQVAQTATLTGTRPSVETFLPHRATPRERILEDAAKRETDFQSTLGQYDLTTSTGAAQAFDAAVKAGAHDAAADISRNWRTRQQNQRDVAAETYVMHTIPMLQQHLETISTEKGITPTDVGSVQAALNAAAIDPSPQNQQAVRKALSDLPKMAAQRRQFDQRMEAMNKRLEQLDARGRKVTEGGNLLAAERNARYTISQIDKEIRDLKRETEFADPQTKGRTQGVVDDLTTRRDALMNWLGVVTSQRSETPGTGLPAPVTAPPPVPRGAGQKGTGIPSKYLKKPGPPNG